MEPMSSVERNSYKNKLKIDTKISDSNIIKSTTLTSKNKTIKHDNNGTIILNKMSLNRNDKK